MQEAIGVLDMKGVAADIVCDRFTVEPGLYGTYR